MSVTLLCINQNNFDEKNAQVAIMADIYIKAMRTVIWLGVPEGIGCIAFPLLRLLADSSNMIPSAEDLLNSPELAAEHFDLTRWGKLLWPLPPPLVLSIALKDAALARLLRSPCFQRMWTIQGLFCSQDRLAVYGDDALPWAVLEKGLKYAEALDIMAESWLGTNMALSYFANASLQIVNSRTLYSNLRFFHTWQASDPRDKVFALHGMS